MSFEGEELQDDHEELEWEHDDEEDFRERVYALTPDYDADPVSPSENHVEHFARESFTKEESYEYMKCFFGSLYDMVYWAFAKGAFDITGWLEPEKPGEPDTDEFHEATLRFVADMVRDPGNVGRDFRRVAAETTNQDEDYPLIPRSEWDSLPNRLDLSHVAALMRITQKNVRNIVSRRPGFLPPMIAKPAHRKRKSWKWEKEPFLKFIEEEYAEHYEN